MSYHDQHEFDEVLYNKTLDDPRISVETVYTSLTGIRITTTTASLSTLASVLIIFIIFRSKTKMGSVYHRIMFGMSFYDIIQSLAMAFTTVPMPKNMIYEQFEGLIIGTEDSCRAQGFMFIIGMLASTSYNAMLCLYYLFSLHFQLTDDKIKRYIEPALHALPSIAGLVGAWFSLHSDLIHPTPLVSYCVNMQYPYWCTEDESDCLLRDGYSYEGNVLMFRTTAAFFGITFLICILSLTVVVWSIFKRERNFRRAMNDVTTEGDETFSIRIREYRNEMVLTKSALRQSLYYVGALIAVFTVPLIALLSSRQSRSAEASTVDMSAYLQVLHVILRPSQGVFNLLIFVHHKVWALGRKERNQNLTVRGLLIAVVFLGVEAEEMPISSLEPVIRQEHINALDFAVSGDDEIPLESINFSVASSAGRIIDSTGGSRIEGISYGTSIPDTNGGLSWHDDGELPSNVSATSIGEDGTVL